MAERPAPDRPHGSDRKGLGRHPERGEPHAVAAGVATMPIKIPKRTKRDQREGEKFIAGVEALLAELGATHSPVFIYPWTLSTPIGALEMKPEENAGGGPGTLLARWDDAAAARKAGFDSNPYSGKWNHHFFSGSADDAVKMVRFWLTRAKDGRP